MAKTCLPKKQKKKKTKKKTKKVWLIIRHKN